jgi:hypothetical protein
MREHAVTSGIPVPPVELRSWVGPSDPADYDNPTGLPLFHRFGIPPDGVRLGL